MPDSLTQLRGPPDSVAVLALRPVRPDAAEASDPGRLAAPARHRGEHLRRPRRRDIVVFGRDDRVAADFARQESGHCPMGMTFSARGPFGPWPSVNDTRWPGWRSSNRAPSTADRWKKRSLPPPTSMNPD